MPEGAHVEVEGAWANFRLNLSCALGLSTTGEFRHQRYLWCVGFWVFGLLSSGISDVSGVRFKVLGLLSSGISDVSGVYRV